MAAKVASDDDMPIPEAERPPWYFDFESAFSEVFWIHFEISDFDINDLEGAEVDALVHIWDINRREAEAKALQEHPAQWYIAEYHAVYHMSESYCD